MNYDKVAAFVKTCDTTPTREDIKRGTGLSGQAVASAVAKLRANGLYPEDAESTAALYVDLENTFSRVLVYAQNGGYDRKSSAVNGFCDALGLVQAQRAKRAFPERYQQMVEGLEATVDTVWSREWSRFGEKLQSEMKELYSKKGMTVWEAASAVAIRHLKPWHEGAGIKP